ncbi:hypothetical protein EC973_000879 [Apophysomyces ossiformis]|uniref:General stress protein FMN-binding split barrel domain-containing protein n=1 Tax=Apophysomyces ossiformis TaxID=679940 RepID=A0A8H7BIK9_9FUNG|nr:hypothetical protein EC973_000879 [Apophysomyces ossiformis]
MNGLSGILKASKKPEIIPLVVILGGAVSWAGFMGWRQLRSPEVSWDHKNNPHPWQEIKDGEQVKLVAVNQKYNQRWDQIMATIQPEGRIEDLYKLIEGIKVCMMTTRCADTGRLVSRAMCPRTPTHTAPADLWFFANNTTHKFEELQKDANVNLAFYKPSSGEWVSVSGEAEIVSNRSKIRELYSDDIKAWFQDLGDGTHNGGPDDPRISLIFVKAITVHYSVRGPIGPVEMWHLAKGALTGEPPHERLSERDIDTEELQNARQISGLDESIVG